MSNKRLPIQRLGAVAIELVPELAVLWVLDNTLQVATSALTAAQPGLAEPDRPYWLTPMTPSSRRAATVIRLGHRLHEALDAYRLAATAEALAKRADHVSTADDEIPF